MAPRPTTAAEPIAPDHPPSSRLWRAAWALVLLGAAACTGQATRTAPAASGEVVSMRTFDPVYLESECYNLPYGIDAASFHACIAESAKRYLPPFDPAHPENFGKEYDPAKYVDCMQKSPIRFDRHITRKGDKWQTIIVAKYRECEKFRRLKPQEPEVWPVPTRPELPPLPDGRAYDPPAVEPDNKNLHSLSGRYFERLCKGEAKEVILRTVEDVEGVYFIRPNVAVKAYEWTEPHLLDHLIMIGDLGSLAPFRPPTAPDAMRNPGWYAKSVGKGSAMRSLLQPAIIWPDDFRSRGRLQPQDFSFSPVYRYLEFPRWDAVPNDPRPYTRAIRNPRLDVEMQRRPGDRDGARPEWINYDPVFEAVAQPQARYGVTWRGFEPSPGDRERGIYGNEYLIVDLSKNEVMAYARDFAFSGRPSAKYWASRGGWVDNAMPCRGGPVMPSFLNRVLKPQSTFKVGASKP